MAFAVALLGMGIGSRVFPYSGSDTRLHYAPNRNFDRDGGFLPGRIGFNVADVSSVRQLNSLPLGDKGLVWVGQCGGVTALFVHTVQPYAGNPNLLGFYLMDNPDPRSRLIAARYSPPCTAEHLRAESDWIHAHAPGAKVFIILMNLSSSRTPSFDRAYTPSELHVDLFGLDPYPCRSELGGCNYDMIDRYVAAAEASGIPRSQMVPVYQAFGGGTWTDDGGGKYVLPTVEQERLILARWSGLVARPFFDYAYSWGSQQGDHSLESASDLRAVFAAHNGAGKPTWMIRSR